MNLFGGFKKQQKTGRILTLGGDVLQVQIVLKDDSNEVSFRVLEQSEELRCPNKYYILKLEISGYTFNICSCASGPFINKRSGCCNIFYTYIRGRNKEEDNKTAVMEFESKEIRDLWVSATKEMVEEINKKQRNTQKRVFIFGGDVLKVQITLEDDSHKVGFKVLEQRDELRHLYNILNRWYGDVHYYICTCGNGVALSVLSDSVYTYIRGENKIFDDRVATAAFKTFEMRNLWVSATKEMVEEINKMHNITKPIFEDKITEKPKSLIDACLLSLEHQKRLKQYVSELEEIGAGEKIILRNHIQNEYCALCSYYRADGYIDCSKCLGNHCKNTPWVAMRDAINNYNKEEFLIAIQVMIVYINEYLKKVLDEDPRSLILDIRAVGEKDVEVKILKQDDSRIKRGSGVLVEDENGNKISSHNYPCVRTAGFFGLDINGSESNHTTYYPKSIIFIDCACNGNSILKFKNNYTRNRWIEVIRNLEDKLNADISHNEILDYMGLNKQRFNKYFSIDYSKQEKTIYEKIKEELGVKVPNFDADVLICVDDIGGSEDVLCLRINSIGEKKVVVEIVHQDESLRGKSELVLKEVNGRRYAINSGVGESPEIWKIGSSLDHTEKIILFIKGRLRRDDDVNPTYEFNTPELRTKWIKAIKELVKEVNERYGNKNKEIAMFGLCGTCKRCETPSCQRLSSGIIINCSCYEKWLLSCERIIKKPSTLLDAINASEKHWVEIIEFIEKAPILEVKKELVDKDKISFHYCSLCNYYEFYGFTTARCVDCLNSVGDYCGKLWKELVCYINTGNRENSLVCAKKMLEGIRQYKWKTGLEECKKNMKVGNYLYSVIIESEHYRDLMRTSKFIVSNVFSFSSVPDCFGNNIPKDDYRVIKIDDRWSEDKAIVELEPKKEINSQCKKCLNWNKVELECNKKVQYSKGEMKFSDCCWYKEKELNEPLAVKAETLLLACDLSIAHHKRILEFIEMSGAETIKEKLSINNCLRANYCCLCVYFGGNSDRKADCDACLQKINQCCTSPSSAYNGLIDAIENRMTKELIVTASIHMINTLERFRELVIKEDNNEQKKLAFNLAEASEKLKEKIDKKNTIIEQVKYKVPEGCIAVECSYNYFSDIFEGRIKYGDVIWLSKNSMHTAGKEGYYELVDTLVSTDMWSFVALNPTIDVFTISEGFGHPDIPSDFEIWFKHTSRFHTIDSVLKAKQKVYYMSHKELKRQLAESDRPRKAVWAKWLKDYYVADF